MSTPTSATVSDVYRSNNHVSAGRARPDLRGWTVGSLLICDFRRQLFQESSTQIGYNTNCCGLAVQLRTIDEGVGRRREMRLSFAVANIGSFGNLRRQERLL